MSTPRSDRTYNRLLPKVGRQLPANDREQAKVYRGERDALRARLDAALALHRPEEQNWGRYVGKPGLVLCDHCGEEQDWPCATARALGVTAPQPERTP